MSGTAAGLLPPGHPCPGPVLKYLKRRMPLVHRKTVVWDFGQQLWIDRSGHDTRFFKEVLAIRAWKLKK
jgi:hypothetical protein